MHEIKTPVQELLLKMGGEGLICKGGWVSLQYNDYDKASVVVTLITILGDLGCT